MIWRYHSVLMTLLPNAFFYVIITVRNVTSSFVILRSCTTILTDHLDLTLESGLASLLLCWQIWT
jgi:hypothetical protein